MCEYCIQHVAGKKWYLAAQNYAQELARSENRESFIHDFFKNYSRNYHKNVRKMDIAGQLPFIKDYALLILTPIINIPGRLFRWKML